MNKKKTLTVALALMLSNAAIFAGNLSIRLGRTTVKKAMTEIRQQVGYSFVYESADVDVNRSVSVNASDLDGAIEQVLSGQNLDYTIKGKNIIVYKTSARHSRGTAQQKDNRRVKGHVRDANGEPIIGATVRVEGTNRAAVTDIDGNFSIDAASGERLSVSYVGFAKSVVNVGNKSDISVVLNEQGRSIDEVVVVGYGSQIKKTLTGAISSVKAKDIEAPNAVSADNLLQGKVAGLNISQNSAQPGTGMSVNIRGKLSPNGSNSPLYVIDGVVVSSDMNKAGKPGPSDLVGYSLRDGSDRSPLATLNPNDIASIDVLKDASATAIYGSSAANGVIIITTKQGLSGKPRVTYSGSFSVQGVNKYFDMLNAQQFMTLSNLGKKEEWLFNNRYAPYGDTPAPATGWSENYTQEDIANAKSYNHFNEIKRTGLIHNHNVSMTAGSENFKFYSSFNYFDQKSILKTTDLRRFSGRFNMEARFNRRLKLNLNSMYTVMNADNPSSGMWRANANEANQTNAALYFSPRLPLTDEDGNLTLPENALSPNPLKFSLIKDKTTTKRLMFAPNLEFQIMPFLKANVQLSVDKTDEMRDVFSPEKARMAKQIQKNFGGFSSSYNNNYGVEEYLTLDNVFGGKHRVNAVLGTGYYTTSGNSYGVTAFNFPTDALENNYLEITSDVKQTLYNSYRWERNKLSLFGRVNYSYKDRYTIGVTFRNDGSSVFADNHKWGWFPGVSAAWTISEESFMKKADWINFLKLRAGVGTSGNESILTSGNYSLTTYGMVKGALYYYGGALNKGIVQLQKGNKNLKWETDVTVNMGLDFSLLNDRLSGSFDYYIRTAKDLLDFASLPTADVVARYAKNIGSTRSTGWELALKGTIIQKKDFSWTAYTNLSHNRSYWVERNPEVSLASWIDPNGVMSPLYGWKANGIFHSLDEVKAYKSNGNVLQPNALPGNKKYVDINGDGVLDDKDIVYLGNSDPMLNFGLGMSLRYKAFTIDIDTYGRINQKRYDNWIFRSLAADRNNTSVKAYEVWTSFNPNGNWPGIATDITGNNNKSGSDDFGLKSVSFWRFKNIKLSYDLPRNWLQHNKLGQGAQVYVDLQNTLLLSNYEGLDPEMEQNAAPFPIPFTMVVGVNITF